MANRLHVYAVEATNAMDNAIRQVRPNAPASSNTRNVPISAETLAQSMRALRAAKVLTSDPRIAEIYDAVAGAEPGTTEIDTLSSEIQTMSFGFNNTLNDPILAAAYLYDDTQIAAVNTVARTGTVSDPGNNGSTDDTQFGDNTSGSDSSSSDNTSGSDSSSSDNTSGSDSSSGGPAQGDDSTLIAPAILPVIPGAEGFGITTPAGRGGRVYKVTSLAESGAGTLRECLLASGPRVCVFEVGGYIRWSGDVIIKNPYLTVAGQTAPSPGITIRGGGIRIATHDVLLQHLAIRLDPKNPGNSNGVNISIRGENHGSTNTSNIVIDHVSLSWSWDKLLDSWSPAVDAWSDVTIRNSILSEALHYSIHRSGGPHSTAMLIGPHHKRVSIIGNLFAHNNHRTPYLKGQTTSVVLNNLVYNSAWRNAHLEDVEGHGKIQTSIVNNQVIKGQNSGSFNPLLRINQEISTTSEVYLSGNRDYIISGGNNWDSVEIRSNTESDYRVDRAPVDLSGFTIRPVNEVFSWVLNRAGSRPADRDPVDARVIREVETRTGQRRDSVEPMSGKIDAGGWPALPSTYRALTLPNNPHGDGNGNGYTNLEEWLHSFAAQVEGRAN
jgi:hypothetical protein